MLFIHPPLAIMGEALVFIHFYQVIKDGEERSDREQRSLFLAWLFTVLGLVSGMIWAQAAWGALWSWDPKETATLILFIILSVHILASGRLASRDQRFAISCAGVAGVFVAIFTSLVQGLHSYL